MHTITIPSTNKTIPINTIGTPMIAPMTVNDNKYPIIIDNNSIISIPPFNLAFNFYDQL